MKLHAIAHCRAGDKGNTLTLALIPFDPSHYPFLCRILTAEAVVDHFRGVIAGKVVRYELPKLDSLLFVCEGALDGGVTTSLRADTHGKSLSSWLLNFDLPELP